MNLFGPLEIAFALVLLGLLMAVAEVFFPSGGLLGFFSFAALVGAVVYAYQSGGILTSVSFAAGVVIVLPVVLGVALQIFPKTALGRAVLGSPIRPEDVALDDPRRALVGKLGVARSVMLPSGAVEIEGHVIDCVAHGQAVEPGQVVRVVEVRGNRVVVRLAEPGERPGEEDRRDPLTRPIDELGLSELDIGGLGIDGPEGAGPGKDGPDQAKS